MTNELEQEAVHTRTVVDTIFNHPPVSSIDLRTRLRDVDKSLTRELMVDRLAGRTVSDKDGPLVVAALDVLGVGDERRRLTTIALDSSREPRIRMWAAMALAGDDPRMMDLLITELGPEGMAHLAENALIDLMTIQNPEKLGKTIRRALEEWHQDLASSRLLQRIDRCREGLGISCAEAYAASLQSPRIRKLQKQILDLFVEEASDEGVAFLERLRAAVSNPGERRELQAALLRLRSARIDPRRRIAGRTGRALVSNCDGHGGFIVLGIFDNIDGTQSISELYIHADREIRDGVVHARLSPAEARRTIRHLQDDTQCFFVEVPVERGAALVMRGLEHTGALADVERWEMRQAIRLFRRGLRQGGGDSLPHTLAKSDLKADEIRSLLSRPEYEDTWLFDLSDLTNLGITFGDELYSDDEWIKACAAQIGGTELARRILAMAQHMARWHAWRGEQDAAALLFAMAEDVEKKSEGSLLLHIMLERFADWIHTE